MRTGLLTKVCSSVLCITICCASKGCWFDNLGGGSGGFNITSSDAVNMGFTTVTVPHPNSTISGNWLADGNGAVGNTKLFSQSTGFTGQSYVTDGRINANWNAQILWGGICGQQTSAQAFFIDVQPVAGIGWTCQFDETESAPGYTGEHFALQGMLPATVTSYANGGNTLSSSQAAQAWIWNRHGQQVGTMNSTSVSGSSATFPFPTQTGGSQLGPDIYGISLMQANAVRGVDWIAIASQNTTHAQPFGVAAVGGTLNTNSCTLVGHQKQCTPGSGTYFYPIETLYSAGQIVVNGTVLTVGSHPTSVVAYNKGSFTKTTTAGGGSTTITSTYTGPTRAITVNTGSNSVSVVDLSGPSVLATIAVGTSPTAVAVSSDNSTAYVANYTTKTVSAITLSTSTIAHTYTVAAAPLSLALAASGGLWVGEVGSTQKITLSSGSVSGQTMMNGDVTSLAYSRGQAEVALTLSQASSGHVYANSYSNTAFPGNGTTASPNLQKAAGYTTDYSNPTFPGLPYAGLLANGTLVSPDSQNTTSASATSP